MGSKCMTISRIFKWLLPVEFLFLEDLLNRAYMNNMLKVCKFAHTIMNFVDNCFSALLRHFKFSATEPRMYEWSSA